MREKRNSCIGDSCMPIAISPESSQMEADQAAADCAPPIDMRQRVRKTLTEAFFDGRLTDVVSSIKQEKEARHMDVVEGRGSGALMQTAATQKREEAEAMEDLRQSTHKTFKNALSNGTLSAVLANLKKKREAEELDNTRRSVQNILQTSLADGRLATAVREMFTEKEAKEVEKTRQQVKSTLQNSLLDGRIFDVISQMKKDKLAKQLGEQQLQGPTCEAVIELPMPTKPTTAKTAATRPVKRHSSRTANTA